MISALSRTRGHICTHTHASAHTLSIACKHKHTVHLQNVDVHKATVYDTSQWLCNIKYVITCINFHTEKIKNRQTQHTHTHSIFKHKSYKRSA